jgi:putative nucleotidyltransferase with HDIG domain
MEATERKVKTMNRNGEKILVVDDEMVVRAILRRKLTEEGYACDEASSAEMAMDCLAKNTYGLIIMDIKMPGRSGADILPVIKNMYPEIAVIMATATNSTDTAIQCMKHGAFDYLTKPINLDELALSADRALEQRRLALENKDYQRHLEGKVEEQAEKIRASFLNSITALAYALEAKDKYTSGHSQRVAEIAVAIAREVNLPEERVEKIKVAGLLHDIGKIGVSEEILNKEKALTEEESQQIMAHSIIGEGILKPIVEDKDILDMVRHHHERYDGTGYPDGLSGKDISTADDTDGVTEPYADIMENVSRGKPYAWNAGILAIADAFDAMTSDRPYRSALPLHEAIEEIRRGAGNQFDPVLTEAFLKTRGIYAVTSGLKLNFQIEQVSR